VTVAFVLALMVLGFGLLAAEILVIPGFGLVGLLGIGAVVGAGVIAFSQLGTAAGSLALGGGLVLAGVMAWLLPKTRTGRGMVLDAHVPGGLDQTLLGLVGQEGDVLTPLRPSGSARVAGRVVDVVADGAYVDTGARVRVTKVEGARVVVEPVVQP
jgi:membrane-bound serine protease (ClpP class)